MLMESSVGEAFIQLWELRGLSRGVTFEINLKVWVDLNSRSH